MATTYDKASLVMIPSGYKDDKLYSVKPTDGSGDFTFSRDGAGASPATRVNASGLIEKGRENLLLQSNQFDTTWVTSVASVTGGQADKDGGSTAWLLSKTASFGRVEQSITLAGVYSFSVYAKAGTSNWIAIGANASLVTSGAFFDLGTGAVGSKGSNVVYSKITALSGGWYRCEAVINNPTENYFRIYVADANGDVIGISGNIYIQDAQLEQGLVATDYIETTTAPVSAGLLGDMPRLDYSGGATCPSLLLEPSRVNSLAHSEYLEGYGKLSSGTGSAPVLTTNYTTSIEGVQNATRIQFDRGAGGTSTDWSLFDFSGISLTGDITISFYAKTLSGTSANLLLYTGGFDTNDGDVLALTDDWQRFTISGTNTSGTISFLIGTRGGSTYFYEGGDQTLDVAVYGFQCEAGSYPTSYIPTYGSASTRGDENSIITSATDIIGQTEGTMFYEFNSGKNDGADYVISLSDGSANNRIIIYRSSANQLIAQIRTGATSVAQINTSTLTEDITYKVALGYANNDVVFYVNGSLIGSDTSASIPSTDRIATDNSVGSANFGRPLNQLLLFKTRLTNAELAALTA